MAVYYSLAFFAALIGLTIQEHKHNQTKLLIQLLKFGLIVLIVSLLIWFPWINSLDNFS